MRNNPTSVSKDRSPGDTPKSKRSLAPLLKIPLQILEKERTIIWIPLPVDQDQKNLLLDLSEVRKERIFVILFRMISDLLIEKKSDLEKETEEIIKKMTEEIPIEDLIKKQEKYLREIERLNLAINQKNTPPVEEKKKKE